jgi:hypothetical protein
MYFYNLRIAVYNGKSGIIRYWGFTIFRESSFQSFAVKAERIAAPIVRIGTPLP